MKRSETGQMRAALYLLLLLGGIVGVVEVARSPGFDQTSRPSGQTALLEQRGATAPPGGERAPQAQQGENAPGGAGRGGGPGRGPGGPGGGNAGGGGRPVSVAMGKASIQPMPVRVEAIGAVQTMASVVLRSRVDSQIEDIYFEDGSMVQAGDLLVKLDSRAIEAQIQQIEANLARDRVLLEQAQRYVRRDEELLARNAASRQKLDDSRSTADALANSVRATEAQLRLLKVQLSYYSVVAPISGRVGAANLRRGNMARSGDNSPAMVTINQVSPVYISFSLPQRYLDELRKAIDAGTAAVEASPQGFSSTYKGKVAFIENTVDASTGTILVRAVFDNPAEALWPGAICNIRLNFRIEPKAIVVPNVAVQQSQTGTVVFVVDQGVARLRPVVIGRYVDQLAVIESGLTGTEDVVVDGQLLIVDGTRIQVRDGRNPATADAGAGGGGGGARGQGAGGGPPGGGNRGSGGGRPPQPAGNGG